MVRFSIINIKLLISILLIFILIVVVNLIMKKRKEKLQVNNLVNVIAPIFIICLSMFWGINKVDATNCTDLTGICITGTGYQVASSVGTFDNVPPAGTKVNLSWTVNFGQNNNSYSNKSCTVSSFAGGSLGGVTDSQGRNNISSSKQSLSLVQTHTLSQLSQGSWNGSGLTYYNETYPSNHYLISCSGIKNGGLGVTSTNEITVAPVGPAFSFNYYKNCFLY